MSRLLYVEASPRGDRSRSRRLGRALVEAYRQRHPEVEVDTLDLAREALPEFDGPLVSAKYAILHGQPHTPDQREAWADVERVIERFAAADVYVFAVPMWNFSLPYRLKHYFDLVIQPGYTFTYAEEVGYRGMLTGRPACGVYARGGVYKEPNMYVLDHQRPYLELLLGFMGIGPIESIVIEPTMAVDPADAEQRVADALAEVPTIADRL